MTTQNTIAKTVVDEVGLEADAAEYVKAIKKAVKAFAAETNKAVADLKVRLTTPVDGRVKAMLAHHGIMDPVLPDEVDPIMERLDHTDCPTTSWNAELGKTQKGCPVAGRPRLVEDDAA